jgi:hypothetical protein
MIRLLAIAMILLPHTGMAGIGTPEVVGPDADFIAAAAASEDAAEDSGERESSPRPSEPQERAREPEPQNEEDAIEWMREQHDHAREWVREHQ